jgi:hypothetical protein
VLSTVPKNNKIQKISLFTNLQRVFCGFGIISEMAKGKKNRKGDESDEG